MARGPPDPGKLPLITSLSHRRKPSDIADLLLKLLPDAYTRFYRFLLDRSEWYAAERTFAAFVRMIDQQTPAAALAAAFLGDTASRAYAREGANSEIDALRVAWSRGAPESHLSPEDTRGPREEAVDESVMPAFEAFPPETLTEFIVATNATRQFSLARTWLVRWFKHWVACERGPDLLKALSGAMSMKGFATPADLLDPAFHVALRLHGPKRAFHWLVEAHRHRRGWAGHLHGQDESAARVALAAQHYRSRWPEFVAQTSMPVSDTFGRERDLPDVGLVATPLMRALAESFAEELVSSALLKRMMNHATVGDVTLGHYVAESQAQLRAGWQAALHSGRRSAGLSPRPGRSNERSPEACTDLHRDR